MSQLHAAIAWLAVAAALPPIALGAVLAVGRTRSYRLLDRAILAQAAVTAVAALVGLTLPLSGGSLADPLHLVYAVVAVLGLLVARYLVRGHDPEPAGRWIAAAGVAVLGAIVRLFMTGR